MRLVTMLRLRLPELSRWLLLLRRRSLLLRLSRSRLTLVSTELERRWRRRRSWCCGLSSSAEDGYLANALQRSSNVIVLVVVALPVARKWDILDVGVCGKR